MYEKFVTLLLYLKKSVGMVLIVVEAKQESKVVTFVLLSKRLLGIDVKPVQPAKALVKSVVLTQSLNRLLEIVVMEREL